MTKISLVNTTDRTTGTQKAVDLLKINPVKGKAVVLKPNFNTADPAPGSTDYDTLHALIKKLQEMGAKKITLAERSGPGPSTNDNLEKKGIFKMAQELGFDILDLQAMPQDGWVLVKPKGSHWKDGFLFPKIYQQAESIVTTCCLKTHQFGGHFTLSLKLSVGMEYPTFQAGSAGMAAARSGGTLELAYLCGRLTVAWEFHITKVMADTGHLFNPAHLVTFRDWNGQLPKEITCQRCEEKFGIHVDNARSIENNFTDAIMLGKWFIEQSGKVSCVKGDGSAKREDF